MEPPPQSVRRHRGRSNPARRRRCHSPNGIRSSTWPAMQTRLEARNSSIVQASAITAILWRNERLISRRRGEDVIPAHDRIRIRGRSKPIPPQAKIESDSGSGVPVVLEISSPVVGESGLATQIAEL